MTVVLYPTEKRAREEAEELADKYRARVEVLRRTDTERPVYVATTTGDAPAFGQWEIVVSFDRRVTR